MEKVVWAFLLLFAKGKKRAFCLDPETGKFGGFGLAFPKVREGLLAIAVAIRKKKNLWLQ